MFTQAFPSNGSTSHNILSIRQGITLLLQYVTERLQLNCPCTVYSFMKVYRGHTDITYKRFVVFAVVNNDIEAFLNVKLYKLEDGYQPFREACSLTTISPKTVIL
jgi:hypothetical protein